MKKRVLTFLLIIPFLFMICSNASTLSKNTNSLGFGLLSYNQKNIIKTSAIIENMTGNCTAGIYNLYFYENTTLEGFTQPSNYTKMWPVNTSLENFDYNLTAAKFSLTVTAMTEPFKTLSIANDTSKAMNGTNNINIQMLAQNFTLNEPSHVDYIYIYLNYTNIWPFIWAGIVHVDICKNNDLENRVNQGDLSIYLPDSGYPNWTANWFNVRYNNLLKNGNYFLRIYTQSTSIWLAPNNNSWQIQNYTNPADDKGATLIKNSTGNWNPIVNDGHADFLLMMNVSTYLNPETVNLTCFLNNQILNFTHHFEENPGFLRFPWSSDVDYYFPAVPTDDINITITVNRSLGWGAVISSVRYLKFLNATGTFSISLDNRSWAINYTSINSTSSIYPVLVFPMDWTVSKFYDRYGKEVIEYGIMLSNIYNVSYNGIFYSEYGDGETTFNYSAVFSSHNYVNKINPQLYFEDSFQSKVSFYKGDTLRIQATIQDSNSRPALEGNCSVYVYDPSNILVFNESINTLNGIANFSILSTSEYTVGDYTVIVTWTNGTEIGFDSFTFSLQNKLIPFIPSSSEPIWLYIVITVLAVLTAVVGSMIVRRKVQERNWEKSLLHLFIMAKDGRSMYNYPFGIQSTDPTLISGMLTAISSFVKETMGSKQHLKTIDQQDKKVILGHGNYCTVALFSEKNLPIIHNKTSDFVKSFETSYLTKIKDWNGDISIFKGVNKIVEKYFPVSIENKIIQGVGRELLELKERINSSTDPQEILQLLKQTTDLTEKYQNIIRDHFNKQYGEILSIANKKIQNQ